MNFNIDVAIVVAFLALNLCIGLYYGRGVKNIKDYALGGRNFNTGTLIATIVATWIGGNSIGIATFDSTDMGVFFMVPGLSDAVSFLLLGYIIIPRMARFLGSLSIAEAMGSLYGNQVRIISAISGIIPAVGSIAIQFVILSSMISYLFGVSSSMALILSSLIVISYSAVGGIRAITFTDVIQFATFGVVIPTVAFIIWQSFDSNQPIYNTLSTNPIFDYSQLFDYKSSTFNNNIILFLFFIIPGFDPTVFQRVSMAKDISQASRAFTAAGLIMFCCQYLVLYLIGLLLLSSGIEDLNANNIIPYIFDNYLSTGFKGIFLIGILAMAMSTSDSYINSSSVLLINDLLKPIGIKFDSKRELFITRISAIIVGLIALILCAYSNSLLDLILNTYSFYLPIVSVPFLLSVFGFRTTSQNVLLGMFAGFCIVIWFKLFSETDSLIPGMLANLFCLLIVHYSTGSTGGWIGNKNNIEFDKVIDNRIRKRKLLLSSFYNLLLNLANYTFYKRYFENIKPKFTSMYIYFAINLALLFISILFLDKNIYQKHNYLINSSIIIVLSISVIFFWSILWVKKIPNLYIGIIWFICVFFNLLLVSSWMTFLTQFSYTSLTVFTIHLVTIPILLGWRTAFVMIPLGLWFSFSLYQSFVDDLVPENIEDIKIKLIYLLLVFAGFSLTILKSKQEDQESAEAKLDILEEEVTHLETQVSNLNETVTHYSERISDQEKEIERLGATAQRILNNINHELRLPVGNVMNFAEMLNEGLGKLSDKQLKILSDEVYKNSNRLSSMIMNMLDLATLNAKKLELDKKKINLGELVEDRVNNCRKMYLKDKKIDFVLKIDPDILISVDPNYIRQVVDNLLINSIKFSNNGVIYIELLKKKGLIEFKIQDNGIGIPKEELYDVFTPFKMGSNTASKAEGRGIGLALCKAAIEAHGGSITAESSGIGATFRFVLRLT